jgi:hypothetical protein
MDDADDDALKFIPPSPEWEPPVDAGRAILRALLAVKARRAALDGSADMGESWDAAAGEKP